MFAVLAAALGMASLVAAPKIPWPLGLYKGHVSSRAAHAAEEPEVDHSIPSFCCGKTIEQEASVMISAEHMTFSSTQRVYSDGDGCGGPYVERAYTTLARIDSFDAVTGILTLKIWKPHEAKHEVRCFHAEMTCPSPSFFSRAIQPCRLTFVEIGGRSPLWSGPDATCNPNSYGIMLASREPAWLSKPWCRQGDDGDVTVETGRIISGVLKGTLARAAMATKGRDGKAGGDGEEKGVHEYSRVWSLTLTTPVDKQEHRQASNGDGAAEELRPSKEKGSFLSRLLTCFLP